MTMHPRRISHKQTSTPELSIRNGPSFSFFRSAAIMCNDRDACHNEIHVETCRWWTLACHSCCWLIHWLICWQNRFISRRQCNFYFGQPFHWKKTHCKKMGKKIQFSFLLFFFQFNFIIGISLFLIPNFVYISFSILSSIVFFFLILIVLA